MSRVAKKPIIVPTGVEVNISGDEIKIKGPKGTAVLAIQKDVKLKKEDNIISVLTTDAVNSNAFAGTTRALVNNMVMGVTSGFERKLILVGVGFKAQVQGKVLNLVLGFSHPVKFSIPDGIKIETPSQTEVVIKGIDKHLVGQVAAEIRSFRPPEPYKGKGVKYDDEVIKRKEGKKK